MNRHWYDESRPGVESPPRPRYDGSMDHLMDLIDAPQAWITVLEESKAALERGEVVPLEPVLARMRASIARMEDRSAEEFHTRA